MKHSVLRIQYDTKIVAPSRKKANINSTS